MGLSRGGSVPLEKRPGELPRPPAVGGHSEEDCVTQEAGSHQSLTRAVLDLGRPSLPNRE